MKKVLSLMLLAVSMTLSAEEYKAVSPDGQIVLTVDNAKKLTYSVTYRGETMVASSPMGFEFVKEKPMVGDFVVTEPVRTVQKELTGFSVPAESIAWMSQFKRNYFQPRVGVRTYGRVGADG